MYVPAHFEEKSSEIMHALIKEHGFGALVTLGTDGLNANHVPFEISAGEGEFGTLRAHVARSNPVWRDFSREVDAMVIFQGAHAYITPSWYETKKESGKVVPTYNYMVVHAYGEIKAIEDAAWLRTFVGRLTDRNEAGRAAPWSVDDAPQDYIEKLLGAIVGIEIPIKRLVGKWKTSQNQPPVNRASVVAGLRAEGGENALVMAESVLKTAKN